MYGDIDILVLPEDFGRTFDLLCASGYTIAEEKDEPNSRHIGFTSPNGREIELHRHFSSSDNEKENEILDTWLYDGIKNAERVNINGYEAPVLPTLENGLILLGHINQHLCAGLGLRQIIDWMLYVRTELTDKFWEESFRERAEKIGMDCLAKTVTKMCKKHLGLDNGITWCDDADGELADELMLYILDNGNFGWKTDLVSAEQASIACRLTNPVSAFRYLTKAGTVHMKEAGLKPRKLYAWIYQLGHLFLKFIKTRNKRGIARGIKRSIRQKDFMKRLHVTRI